MRRLFYGALAAVLAGAAALSPAQAAPVKIRFTLDWKLQGLLNRLPQTKTQVTLIASEGDRAVPAQVSIDAAKRIPGARLHLLPKLGHLAHEETEDGLSALILHSLGQP